VFVAVLVAVTNTAVSTAGHALDAHPAKAAPAVQSMVVGASGQILFGPRTIKARAVTTEVSTRRCAVGKGTPLAALLAVQHAGGPRARLRDYGHCGPAPADSGQLFVYSLAGESNTGQNGWEYKVGHLSGSTGAAEESGPFGDGRLLTSGQRVLWFWCVAQTGGCQRTLDFTTSPTSPAPGSELTVTVTGYENAGNGAPVTGATVTIDQAHQSAITGPDGTATLAAPSTPGRYRISVEKAGLVTSFPQTITVT
jgi:hypothetical protein